MIIHSRVYNVAFKYLIRRQSGRLQLRDRNPFNNDTVTVAFPYGRNIPLDSDKLTYVLRHEGKKINAPSPLGMETILGLRRVMVPPFS